MGAALSRLLALTPDKKKPAGANRRALQCAVVTSMRRADLPCPGALNSVKLLRAWSATKRSAGPTKPFFYFGEEALKRANALMQMLIKQRSSIMWDIINRLYYAYCLARLTEMRRVRLTH